MNDCQTTMLSPSQTSTHSVNDKCKAKKYGRQSTIPLEYRDQTRRVGDTFMYTLVTFIL